LNAHSRQCFTHVFQLERFDHHSNQLHFATP
jgi:hypothetical protein